MVKGAEGIGYGGGGFYPSGTLRDCVRGICPGLFMRGDYVREIVSGGYCPGEFFRVTCPGYFVPGDFVLRPDFFPIPHFVSHLENESAAHMSIG